MRKLCVLIFICLVSMLWGISPCFATAAVTITSISTSSGACAGEGYVTVDFTVTDSTGLTFGTGSTFSIAFSNNNFLTQTVGNNTVAGQTATSYSTSITPNLPTTAGTYTVRVICNSPVYNSVPYSGTITVNPLPSFTPAASCYNCYSCSSGSFAGSACEGGTINMAVTPQVGMNYNYQWDNYSTTNCGYITLSNSTTYSGVNTASLAVTDNNTSDLYYFCEVTNPATGCWAISSTYYTSFSAAAVVTQEPGIDTICIGGSDTLTAGATPEGTTATWQYYNGSAYVSIAAGTPAGAVYSVSSPATTGGGTGILSTLTVSGISVPGTYYYRASFSGNGCSAVTSNPGTIVVSGIPDVVTIEPANTVCAGGTVTAAATGTDLYAPFSYQWQDNGSGTWANAVNNSPPGSSYSGSTASSMQISSLTQTGEQYGFLCNVTSSYSGCTFSTSSITVTVTAGPTAVGLLSADSICPLGAFTDSVVLTGGATITGYQWQYYNGSTWGNVTANAPAGASYTNSTSSKLSVSGISPLGTYQFRCLLALSGTGCNSVTSSVSYVNVVTNPSVAVQPSSPSPVCAGGQFSFGVAGTGGAGSLTYQWQYSTTGTSNWVSALNGTPSNAVYTSDVVDSLYVSGISPGTYYWRCVVGATASGCVTTTSNVVSETVIALPAITSEPTASISICPEGSTTFGLTASGGTPFLTYQWQYDSSGTWVNVSSHDSIASTTLVLTSSGTFTVPEGVSSLTVYMWGGGGAGGGYSSLFHPTDWANGGGGGGGACGITTFAASTGQVYNITIGAGGAGTTGSGGVGGSTSISGPAGTWTVGGGAGGAASSAFSNNNNAGGAGGSAGSGAGLTLYQGGSGSYGSDASGILGCGGGGAGSGGAGTSAVNGSCILSAAGGAGTYPGGTGESNSYGCSSEVGGNNGSPGLIPGGGGGGCTVWSESSGSGGAGAQGEVIIKYLTPSALTNIMTISGISTPGTYPYNCIVSASGNGCTSVTSSTVNLTVVAQPYFSQQAPTEATCPGGSATITSSAAGGTPSLVYQWEYYNGGTWANVTNGTPAGSTYTGQTAASLGVSGITTLGSYQYRTMISASGNGCGAAISNADTLTVVAEPSITTQPTNQAIVSGGTAIFSVSAVGGTPSLTYQWQYDNAGTWMNVVDGSPSGANYSNQNTNSLTVSGVSGTGNNNYRCIVGAAGSNCNPVTSNSATLNIVSQPTFNSQPANQFVCPSGSAVFSVTAVGGTPSIIYQWQDSSTGGWNNVGAGFPSGATYANPTGPSLTVGGIITIGQYAYRCYITSSGSGSDTVYSNTAYFTVDAQPSITQQPVNPVPVCPGGVSAMSISASGGTPPLIYEWQYFNGSAWTTVASGTPAGSGYSGQTTNTLTVSSISTSGNYQYRGIVLSSGSACNAVISNPDTVVVVVPPTITTQPANQAIVTGGTAIFSLVAAGGTGALTYQWQYDNAGVWTNVADNIPPGVIYSNQTTDSLTVSSVADSGSSNYRCVVSSTGSGCNSATSVPAVLTVEPQPGFITQPFNQSVCQSGSSAFSVTATGGTPYIIYQWQDSTASGWNNVINGTPSGATYSNATGASLTVSGIAVAGSYPYRCYITSTGSGSDTAYSSSAYFVVVAQPTIVQAPVNPVNICTGGSSYFNLTATGGTPALTYQWQYSPNGTSWSNVANNLPAGASYLNPIADTLAVSGISNSGTYYYQCIVSASGRGCNSVTSSTASLSVVPQATPSTPTLSNSSICTGGSTVVTENPVLPGTGSLGYRWQYDNGGTWTFVTNSQPTGASYTGQASNSLSISGINTSGGYLYRTIITPSGSGCAADTSPSATLTVDVQPSITQSPVSPSPICTGGTTGVSVSAASAITPITYSWQYSPNGSNWTGVASGVPAGAVYTNPHTDSLTVSGISSPGTYHYQCLVSASGSGCSSVTSGAATVTVVAQAAPATPAVTSPAICIGGTTTLYETPSTSGAGALSYQWQYNNGVNWASVANGTPSGATYINQLTDSLVISNFNAAVVGQYRCLVTPSGSGCTAQASPSTSVTVKADPVASTPSFSYPSICTGGSNTGSVTVSGGNGAASYQWQYSPDGGSTWSNVSNGLPGGAIYVGATSSQLEVNSDTLVGSPSFRCLINQATSGCATVSSLSSFNIVYGPSLSAPSFTSVCAGHGISSASVHVTGGSGINTFQWQYYNSAGNWQNVSANTPQGAVYSFGSSDSIITISNIADSGAYQYQCILTQSGSSCAAASPSAILVVASGPGVSQEPQNDSVCLGFSSASFNVTAYGGTPSITYQWQVNNNGTFVPLQNNIPPGATYQGSNTNQMQVSGAIASGFYNYQCLVSAAGSGCATGTSSVARLAVLPDPQIIVDPSTHPPAPICAGGTARMSLIATGGVNGLIYQWQYADSGNWENVTGQEPAGAQYSNNGADSLLIINGIADTGTFQYRCIVSAVGNGCTMDTSGIVNVVVNPSPTFANPLQSPGPMCAGGTTALTVTVDSGSLSIQYQWQYLQAGTWRSVSSGVPLGVSYTGGTDSTLNVVVVPNFSPTPDTLIFSCKISSPESSCPYSISDSALVVINANLPASPPISADTICPGGNAVLVNNVTGGTPPYNYVWQYLSNSVWSTLQLNSTLLPDGVTYNNLSDTLSAVFPSGSGVDNAYQYRCVVSSAGAGCTQSTSAIANIEVITNPSASSAGPSLDAICSGGNVTFKLHGGTGTPDIQYTWDYLGSAVTSGSPTGVTSYLGGNTNNLVINTGAAISAGQYIYQYNVSAPYSGCTTANGQDTLQVNSQPALNLNFSPNPAVICSGGSVMLSDSALGGTGSFVYNWEYTADTVNNLPELQSNNPKTYTITNAGFWRLNVEDTVANDGCKPQTTGWLNLIVHPDAGISISDDKPAQLLCVGDSMVITRVDSGGWGQLPNYESVVLQDSISGGNWITRNLATDSIISEQYTVPGTYYYREILVDSAPANTHCAGVAYSNILTLQALPSPVTPQIEPDSAYQLCAGTTNAYFQVNNPYPDYEYVWHVTSQPDSTILTWDNNTHAHISFYNPGLDTLIVVSSINSGLCTDTARVVLNINQDLAPGNLGIVLTQPGGNLFCTNTSFATYQWGYDLRNGTEYNIPGATSPIYESNDSLDLVNRAYWVKVCSAQGCCTQVYFNNPSLVSVQNENKTLFSISPNPTYGYIHLDNINASINRFELYSADGKRLEQFEIMRGINSSSLNLVDYSGGMYFLAAFNGNMLTGITKIIIIK